VRMPKHPCRPSCPKCAMLMIATAQVLNSKQDFECLRCGHYETRRTEMAALARGPFVRSERETPL